MLTIPARFCARPAILTGLQTACPRAASRPQGPLRRKNLRAAWIVKQLGKIDLHTAYSVQGSILTGLHLRIWTHCPRKCHEVYYTQFCIACQDLPHKTSRRSVHRDERKTTCAQVPASRPAARSGQANGGRPFSAQKHREKPPRRIFMRRGVRLSRCIARLR